MKAIERTRCVSVVKFRIRTLGKYAEAARYNKETREMKIREEQIIDKGNNISQESPTPH